MLTVFNVGQGDAFLLSGMADRYCCFDRSPLLIDCGPAKRKVFKFLPKSDIRVLVTHGDADHIGGLADVLSNSKVSHLYVPRFLPELLRIRRYLARKLQIKNTRLLDAHIPDWANAVAEGDNLCVHAKVLNPPRDPDHIFRLLDDNFESSSGGSFAAAKEILKASNVNIDDSDEMWAVDENAEEARSPLGRKFMRGFFVHLANKATKGDGGN